MTLNHVLGLKAVLADGDAGDARRPQPRSGRARPGRRLRRLRRAVRHRARDHAAAAAAAGRLSHRARRLSTRSRRPATRCRASSRSGLLPGAMEIMDHLAIQAAEAAVHAGYPLDAAAVLLVELEGEAADIDAQFVDLEADRRVGRLPGAHRAERGRAAGDLEGPQVGVLRGRPPQPRLHRPGRRRAAQPARRGAGRHRGDRPQARHPRRQRLPRRRRQPAPADPLRRPRCRARTIAPRRAPREILRLCIALGGSITGEHGVGLEKRAFPRRDVRPGGHRLHEAPAADHGSARHRQPGQGVRARCAGADDRGLHPLDTRAASARARAA